MSGGLLIYRRWLRDRRLSTAMWTLGSVLTIVATAAFYPSLSSATGESLSESTGAMSALLGLSAGIDPSTPLGYLWISLYANVVPWVLMALGIAVGTAAVAGDEETGTLEYLLARPVTRTTIADNAPPATTCCTCPPLSHAAYSAAMASLGNVARTVYAICGIPGQHTVRGRHSAPHTNASLIRLVRPGNMPRPAAFCMKE